MQSRKDLGRELAASDLAQLETKERQGRALPSGPWLSHSWPQETSWHPQALLPPATFPNALCAAHSGWAWRPGCGNQSSGRGRDLALPAGFSCHWPALACRRALWQHHVAVSFSPLCVWHTPEDCLLLCSPLYLPPVRSSPQERLVTAVFLGWPLLGRGPADRGAA